MRFGTTLLASAALLSLALPAFADTYLLTATGTDVSVVATLTGTVDPSNSGAIDFTGGSGVWNGSAISLYTPSGTSTSAQEVMFGAPAFRYDSTYYYDNVGYFSGHNGVAVDADGILFSSATDHLNLYAIGNVYAYSNDEIINGFTVPLDSLTLTAVPGTAVTPEPSSIALLGTGLLGVAGVLRRRIA